MTDARVQFGTLVLLSMTQDGDQTVFSMPAGRARQDELIFSRDWYHFLLTLAGLIAFILLAATLRMALS